MEKDNQCVYCQYSNLPVHLYRLISLSFSPFRVSSKKVDSDKMCNVNPLDPEGI